MEFIIDTNISPTTTTTTTTKYPFLSNFGVHFNNIDSKVSYKKKQLTFISIFR